MASLRDIIRGLITCEALFSNFAEKGKKRKLFDGKLSSQIIQTLPYELTSSQKRVLEEINLFATIEEKESLTYIIKKISENKDYSYRFRKFIDRIYESDHFNKINDIKECVHDFYIEKNISNEKKAFESVVDKFSEKYILFYKKAQYAENSPIYVAEQMAAIIKIMLQRIKPESRLKSMNSIRDKIRDVNVPELAQKKSPGGAAIGVTLSLVKNILMARDQFFIDAVIKELILRL